jgi:hypothetical protein
MISLITGHIHRAEGVCKTPSALLIYQTTGRIHRADRRPGHDAIGGFPRWTRGSSPLLCPESDGDRSGRLHLAIGAPASGHIQISNRFRITESTRIGASYRLRSRSTRTPRWCRGVSRRRIERAKGGLSRSVDARAGTGPRRGRTGCQRARTPPLRPTRPRRRTGTHSPRPHGPRRPIPRPARSTGPRPGSGGTAGPMASNPSRTPPPSRSRIESGVVRVAAGCATVMVMTPE